MPTSLSAAAQIAESHALAKTTVVKPSTAPLAETKENLSDLTIFDNGNRNILRPVIFKPNGSFRALKESGKMSCAEDETELYKGRIRNPLANTSYQLSGYTGFVRGRQHLSGRTFGEMTRRAATAEYVTMASDSPIPPPPQANQSIEQKRVKGSFIDAMFGGKDYRLPNYTGFVPRVRATYGVSYGSATEAALTMHKKQYQRVSNDVAGYATMAVPRQNQALDSNPLPGGSLTHDTPNMYIPSHVKYLRYLAQ